jgi:hypothetical protein
MLKRKREMDKNGVYTKDDGELEINLNTIKEAVNLLKPSKEENETNIKLRAYRTVLNSLFPIRLDGIYQKYEVWEKYDKVSTILRHKTRDVYLINIERQYAVETEEGKWLIVSPENLILEKDVEEWINSGE